MKRTPLRSEVVLGNTEFGLRWIAWMCVRNDDLKGKRVSIVLKRLIELFLNNRVSTSANI